MNNYVIYQCTVCRRKKDIPKDNIRVAPSMCTITKGCSGRLYSVGEKNSAFLQTAPLAGVIDWYPRNQTISDDVGVSDTKYVKLSTSDNGGLTIAIELTDEEAEAFSEVEMQISQRKVESISFSQFLFSTTTAQSVFTGRDSQGRNLRIDADALTDERLKVKVNGVPVTNFSVSIDGRTLTFAAPVSAGSVVDIILHAEKDTEQRTIVFTSNRTVVQNMTTGAWGNVKWVNRLSSLGNTKLWVYSATSVAGIGNSSRVRIDGIFAHDVKLAASKIRFLLASLPYSNLDRYLTLSVPMTICEADFNIVTVKESSREFTVDASFVTNEYPSLQIRRGYSDADNSLTVKDVVPASTGATQTDSISARLTNSIINGPS